MTQTVTASYDDTLKARNAFNELVSDGFPRESLFLDEESREVKVIIGDEIRREVEEVLNRHEPAKVWSRPYEGG
ncbi:hypothetical protein ACFPTY_13580 [Halomonas beimenensis]|uniref:Uncharacterized protein n=1 Tax=Halomonas beimenensis TaxID=475662 RepID=A0A291PAZ2_9GAMM|nr:hypothetical protein [Halomonas beimenensis]ATJ84057.1 hypothetical protein BEI_3070 [Halomonas beimenensis]